MDQNIQIKLNKVTELNLRFQFLPGYASYILENKLEAFVLKEIEIARQEHLPLLQILSHLSDDKLFSFTRKSTEQLLRSISENATEDFIRDASRDYVNNRILFFENDSIVAEDITLISFVRRKTLRLFLGGYTSDMDLFMNVMEEVDRYIAYSEGLSFNAFLKIKQEKITEINRRLEFQHHQLIEAQKMAETGSFYWDIINDRSEFTPGVLHIFGKITDESLGSFMENMQEDERKKIYQSIENAAHNNGFFDCEYWYGNYHNQKRIWSKGVVIFENGKPATIQGSIMDITSKYNLVRQLQQSEDLNKQAQSLTHIGNWAWDVTSGEITWSDEMYRIYGLKPQAEIITFDRFISLIHPDDRENRIREISEMVQTHIAKDYRLRIVNPDGTIKVLQGKGDVITKNNRAVKIVGTCQDITREHYLHTELEEKEKYLNQLIANAPDSVIVINETGEIQLWNPKTEEIFGWTSEEVLGKNLTETIIPIQYREAHNLGMKHLREGGQARILNKTLELSAINKSGNEFFISLTISRSLQHGRPIFVAFIRDITTDRQIQAEIQLKTGQLIRLNASLEQKNTELELINNELESFNYIASHDLQEPLRKIHTFASRIIEKEGEVFSPAAVQYFNKIMQSASRMQVLIDDLLTFSQTTSSKNDFQRTDLNVVMEDVKSILADTIEDKKALIYSDRLPVVMGLPSQLHQLLLNLISNSLKYSKDNTAPEINISSMIVRGAEAGIPGALPEKEYFQLKVSDNGIGFEMQNSEKIFELFQRLHHKNKYSGTGIGLAICKKIARNHNGFINACSIPLDGSVFTVHLPFETLRNDILVN